jgi:Sec-independent protein translocase protein TatA
MILVVALIVLGPERLPKAARQLGSYWRTLIQLRGKLEEEFHSAVPDFKEAFPDVGLPRIPKNPRAAVSSFVTGLITPDTEEPAAESPAELAPEDKTVPDASTDLFPAGNTDGDAGNGKAAASSDGGAGATGGSEESHVPNGELASVMAAWQSAVEATNGSTNGAAVPLPEPHPEVEQRSKPEHAPFLDDPTMN